MEKAWIGLLLFLGNIPITVIAASNDMYRPYSHPYPQIIQATDYATIEAIETLVHEMQSAGSNTASCSVAESIMMQHEYTTESTLILIKTLKRLLDDFSLTHPCEAVGFAEFQTISYKQRLVIEFDFGPTVIIIYGFSNGPNNGERFYILDAVDREESFWRTQFFERLPVNESLRKGASETDASD